MIPCDSVFYFVLRAATRPFSASSNFCSFTTPLRAALRESTRGNAIASQSETTGLRGTGLAGEKKRTCEKESHVESLFRVQSRVAMALRRTTTRYLSDRKKAEKSVSERTW